MSAFSMDSVYASKPLYRVMFDRTPARLATHDVGFPDILTEGRSPDEAQAIHRREDHLDP
jgi:hypothetical protein